MIFKKIFILVSKIFLMIFTIILIGTVCCVVFLFTRWFSDTFLVMGTVSSTMFAIICTVIFAIASILEIADNNLLP